MKLSELRIGNYIGIAFLGNPKIHRFEVGGIHSTNTIDGSYFLEGVNTKSEYKGYDLRDFQPIPLTEEWLLRFGFKVDKAKEYLHPSTMNFVLKNITALDSGFKIIAGRPMRGTSHPIFMGVSEEIKYVHQLQNFHFASTGEELTLE